MPPKRPDARASQQDRDRDDDSSGDENGLDKNAMVDDNEVTEMLSRTQSIEEARVLRKEYRALQTALEENKLEYLKSESNGLAEILERSNELFKQVISTQEAALDSKVIVQTAELGIEKVKKMKLAGKSFDIDDFIQKLADVKQNDRPIPNLSQRGQGDRSDVAWATIGDIASKYMLRAPTSDFMLGPLAVEPKARKEVKRVVQRLEKDKDQLRKPQELKESDIVKAENETSKTVQKIAKLLKQHGPVNLFHFFVNPESFSQTVENLFYLSFLVRDGTVVIYDGSDGQPLISRKDDAEEGEGEAVVKRQFVVELTKAMWRDLIDAYQITKPIIPTRSKAGAVAAATGGSNRTQWYG
ncbi:Nse4 C-terminal-domain-containing protein [Zopfochytrium polystomum]|nr:Nse4 C-terminal-domain-containing protein [Zopfochytrium polystomum]